MYIYIYVYTFRTSVIDQNNVIHGANVFVFIITFGLDLYISLV